MSELAGGRPRRDGGVIPLRPLTVGELLDGAVALLRTNGRRLVAYGAALAVVEQAVLFVLRARADQDISMLPGTGLLREYGVLVVAGFAGEAMIIATLAASAAAGSGRALLGAAAPAPGRSRRASLVATVLLVGVIMAVAVSPFVVLVESLQIFGIVLGWFLVCLLWAVPYGLTGLAMPAAVLERRGPGSALVRSLQLSGRTILRAAVIRILGYAGWALVRLGLILATIAVVTIFSGGPLPSAMWDRVALAGAALLVNAVAYPVLGCLDTMLLLETRMRTEGLDIALRWAQRRGVPPSLDAPTVVPSPGPLR